MIEPIKPNEVEKIVPDEVIDSFNELIKKYWTGRESVVRQSEVVELIVEKMGIDTSEIFEKQYLDIESIYISAGWKVEYNSPGYNESYFSEFFRFSMANNK